MYHLLLTLARACCAQFLQLAKLQHNPSVIYVSSRADAALVDALKQPATGAVDRDDGQSAANMGFTVKLERAASFYYDKARACDMQIMGACARMGVRPRKFDQLLHGGCRP